MAIQVNWTRDSGVLVATPVGRVYSSDYLDWQSELESGITPDDTKLVVDFEQVPYLSSAGLRILLTTARRFTEPDHAFCVCALTRPVRKVLAASGFDALVSVYESAEEAVAAIAGNASRIAASLFASRSHATTT